MASVEDTFVSSLSEESLIKAKAELNEDPSNRDVAIHQLRDSIIDKEACDDVELEGVEFQRKDSAFLLRFLRARKFNQERALALYISYHSNRRDHPEIFSEFTPQSVKEILQSGVVTVLDSPGKDGTKLVCLQPRYFDMDSQNVWHLFRAMLLTIDKLLEDEETQVHGMRMIMNYEDVDFMKVWRLSQLEAFRSGVMPRLIQDAIPIRLKGIHIVKQPWYISIVLTIAKPFLKEKIKERINLHGFDYQSLHTLLSQEHLPSDFEGSAPPLDSYIAYRLFNTNSSTIDPGLETEEPLPGQGPVMNNNSSTVYPGLETEEPPPGQGPVMNNNDDDRYGITDV